MSDLGVHHVEDFGLGFGGFLFDFGSACDERVGFCAVFETGSVDFDVEERSAHCGACRECAYAGVGN